jgi:hypothetical protein
MDDLAYLAEVEVTMDGTGNIIGHDWKRGSGQPIWDDSVRQALRQTTKVNKTAPKGFPQRFVVRFDVQTDATEPVIQADQTTKF